LAQGLGQTREQVQKCEGLFAIHAAKKRKGPTSCYDRSSPGVSPRFFLKEIIKTKEKGGFGLNQDPGQLRLSQSGLFFFGPPEKKK